MRILKYLFLLCLLGAVLSAGLVAFTVWHFSRDLPEYQQLASYQPAIVSRVYAGDGRLLGEYATERRIFVPIAAMPPLVVQAFLSAEDKNFYSHGGVDPISILRAGLTDVMHMALGSGRRPIGASTITQQVAKNFLLSSEVSLSRKVKEALLAIRIEQALSKDRILELYLNEIYLGGGAYGVAAAALYYFNKPLDQLTVAEAAYLGALPKAPNNYNPQRFPEAAKARRDWVVDRMLEDGVITAEQAAEAQQGPVQMHRRDDADTVTAAYFSEEVRRELLARFGEKGLYRSGLAVRASLDPALQAAADKALRTGLVNYDRRHGWRGPVSTIDLGAANWQAAFATAPLPPGAGEWKLAVVTGTQGDGAAIQLQNGAGALIPFEEMKWARPTLEDQHVGPVPKSAADVVKRGDVVLVEEIAPADGNKPGHYGLRQIPNVSGGFVAMDPHTGRVLAISGGYSWDMSQFDRAVQAKRQPGSSFKPFVYMAALDHGFTPTTLVLDAPFVVDQGPGLPKWKPTNYNTTKFGGPLPLRQGIEQSKNLMTARLAQVVGLDVVAEYAQKFGVIDHMPQMYSMALGAGETTVLRMVTGYSMIVNGGKKITPTLIDRIQDRDGATIFRADNRDCEGCKGVEWTGQEPPVIPDTRETIEDPRTAYQMVSIMQGVVERGTGTAVKAVGKPLAGKTGTTNDYQDNWFVGFSPDLAAGVYIGFDQPRTLGPRETGGSNGATIFRDFMMTALKDKPAVAFRIPPGLRLVRVDPKTGQPAQPGARNVIYEAFKPGSELAAGGVVSGTESPDDTPLAVAPVGPDGVAAPAPAVPASGTGGLY
jgi:penicillin-binding protein 1A